MRFALVFLGICHPQIRDGGCFVVLLLLVCGVVVGLRGFSCSQRVIETLLSSGNLNFGSLLNLELGCFVCCKFGSLEHNLEWGLIRDLMMIVCGMRCLGSCQLLCLFGGHCMVF